MSHISSFRDFLPLDEAAPVTPAKAAAKAPVAKTSLAGTKDQLVYTHNNLRLVVTRAELYTALLATFKNNFFANHQAEFTAILEEDVRLRPMLKSTVKSFIESRLADPGIQRALADLLSTVLMGTNTLFGVRSENYKGNMLLGDWETPDVLRVTPAAPKIAALFRSIMDTVPTLLRPFISLTPEVCSNPQKMKSKWDECVNVNDLVYKMMKKVMSDVVQPKAAALLNRPANKLYVVSGWDFSAFS